MTTALSISPERSPLVLFEAARRAIAEARSVDEVKAVLDEAARLKLYARQAKDKTLEEGAIEIRMRAERRLGELMTAQREAFGTAQGRRSDLGFSETQVGTLAEAGIDKNLAHHARTMAKLPAADFERAVADARGAVNRTIRRVVREVEIREARADYEARKERGGTVRTLEELIAAGERFNVIYTDNPWTYETYSGKGKQRSAERHYDTMPLEEIQRLPVASLAARDCALLLWAVMPGLPGALEIIKAWGFEYKTVGFTWVKQNPHGDGIFTGMGYWTRANAELVLLATKGSPMRINADVPQVVMTPVGEHSAKPEEVRQRIERLLNGPYLELFGRRPVDGWTVWGNEVGCDA